MRKLIAFLFVFLCMLGLVGCFGKRDYTIKIVVPAGSQGEFVYSDEEISPLKNQLTIQSIDVTDDTRVVLKTIEVKEKTAYEPLLFTKGIPMIIDAEKGAWFRVGISMKNPTDEDIVVCIDLENIRVRIR